MFRPDLFRFFDGFKIVGLAVLYALVARSSLNYFAGNGVISIIWPPSGIALSVLLIAGNRFVFGVFLGSLLANFLSGMPLLTASVIAFGNSLEALFGAWLLTRRNKHFTLYSLHGYLKLVILGGCVASLVSALIGTTVLFNSGFLASESIKINLLHWWMGDVLGVLLIAPLLLTWRQAPNLDVNLKRIMEVLLIFGMSFLAGQIIFLGWFYDSIGHISKAYWMFLFITWAAVRLKARGVVLVIVMTATQALWGAHHKVGYFANDIADNQLINFWLYAVILSLVGMALAMYFTDLKKIEEILREKEILLSESQRIAHVGSWQLDIPKNKLTWTEETYRIYGVSPNTFIPSVESLDGLIHNDDRDSLRAWVNACITGKNPDAMEFRTVHPDGSIRIVSGRGDLILDDGHRPVQMLGTVQDITEHKEAEAKIQRLSRLYAALSQCNQSIVHCSSEEELFPQICRDAVNFGGMKMAWIGLVDPETDQVRIVAQYGDDHHYLEKLDISTNVNSPYGGSPTGTAIRENRPFWCQDFLNDPRTAPWHELAKLFGWRSLAALPICRNGIPIGNFNLYSYELNAFDDSVCHLLIEMAMDISFALDNYEREAKQRAAENALEKSERYLRTIIETEPECVRVVGLEGELVDMNQAGLTIFEAQSVSDIQQKRLIEFVVPECRQAFTDLHNKVLSGEKGILEYEIIGLKGTRRWLETHSAPLRDESGNIVMLLGVSRDITLKKQADRALRESEQRLELVIKGSNDAPWDWDLISKKIYYSPQWWQMLGYEPGELEADDELWQRLLHPDELEIFNRDLQAALESDQDGICFELKLRHKMGHYVPVLSRGFITRDDQGNPLRVSGTNMDLTERYRAQELEELRLFLLEMLTGNLTLQEIMVTVVGKLESIISESLCSILLVDKDAKLSVGAAPSFPEYYNRAIEGLVVGVGVGSCGNAIATSQRTIVEDITTHPFWTNFSEIANEAGLASCWSEPILSSVNKVLGSFAIYHRRPTVPTDHHLKLIEMTAHFTAHAIERRRAEANVKLAAKVFEQSHEGFLITDDKRKIIMVNQAFTSITGYTEAEVLGKSSAMLASGQHDESFYQNIWTAIKEKGFWQGEIWSYRKNGEAYPELLNVSVVRDETGKVSEYVGVFADITQIKTSEKRLEFLAHHDPLTALPNRLLLFLRLQHGIDVAKRENKQLALLMLDLDRFKDVNDSLGHLAGDQLLKLVAGRLTGRLRDIDTVARLGGDEFTVLLEDISHPEDAARVAESIITDLSEPWTLAQGSEVRIGVSIGISLYPQYGDTPEMLLQQADTALYQAKGSGRNRFAYFSDELTLAVRRRIDLEARLRRAISANELRVFYQPQIDIRSGRIVGAEALIRWQDPVAGLISPIQFIPVAEQTGLIIAIGEWVLRETCRQGVEWMNAGMSTITLAVNVSPYQLRQSDINRLVATVLQETGFPAEHLELELTESGLMERDEEAVDLLNNLRQQGVRLAIDDFGTGYSSLAYLKQFPLDVLKIDKSFIDEIPHNQDDMEIAATIIAIGHTLGFNVLAEGVENADQLAFLKERGCDMFQGYLVSRPLPAQEFATLLQEFSLPNK